MSKVPSVQLLFLEARAQLVGTEIGQYERLLTAPRIAAASNTQRPLGRSMRLLSNSVCSLTIASSFGGGRIRKYVPSPPLPSTLTSSIGLNSCTPGSSSSIKPRTRQETIKGPIDQPRM